MDKLTSLKPRVSMLSPRLTANSQADTPWQKNALSPKRMTARPRQRQNAQIKLRDKYTCQKCGIVTTDLEVDHRVPLSEGGTEHESNKQSLCIQCHASKTAKESGQRNMHGGLPGQCNMHGGLPGQCNMHGGLPGQCNMHGGRGSSV